MLRILSFPLFTCRPVHWSCVSVFGWILFLKCIYDKWRVVLPKNGKHNKNMCALLMLEQFRKSNFDYRFDQYVYWINIWNLIHVKSRTWATAVKIYDTLVRKVYFVLEKSLTVALAVGKRKLLLRRKTSQFSRDFLVAVHCSVFPTLYFNRNVEWNYRVLLEIAFKPFMKNCWLQN